MTDGASVLAEQPASDPKTQLNAIIADLLPRTKIRGIRVVGTVVQDTALRAHSDMTWDTTGQPVFVVAVSSGLYELLTSWQLRAGPVAHELAHIENSDLLGRHRPPDPSLEPRADRRSIEISGDAPSAAVALIKTFGDHGESEQHRDIHGSWETRVYALAQELVDDLLGIGGP